MTTNKPVNVRSILRDYFDTVSQRDGVWTVRQSFFYRHGGSAEDLWQRLVKLSATTGCTFTLVDMGEVWKPFRGGASVAQGSHWFVKFRVA